MLFIYLAYTSPLPQGLEAGNVVATRYCFHLHVQQMLPLRINLLLHFGIFEGKVLCDIGKL